MVIISNDRSFCSPPSRRNRASVHDHPCGNGGARRQSRSCAWHIGCSISWRKEGSTDEDSISGVIVRRSSVDRMRRATRRRGRPLLLQGDDVLHWFRLLPERNELPVQRR